MKTSKFDVNQKDMIEWCLEKALKTLDKVNINTNPNSVERTELNLVKKRIEWALEYLNKEYK